MNEITKTQRLLDGGHKHGDSCAEMPIVRGRYNIG